MKTKYRCINVRPINMKTNNYFYWECEYDEHSMCMIDIHLEREWYLFFYYNISIKLTYYSKLFYHDLFFALSYFFLFRIALVDFLFQHVYSPCLIALVDFVFSCLLTLPHRSCSFFAFPHKYFVDPSILYTSTCIIWVLPR